MGSEMCIRDSCSPLASPTRAIRAYVGPTRPPPTAHAHYHIAVRHRRNLLTRCLRERQVLTCGRSVLHAVSERLLLSPGSGRARVVLGCMPSRGIMYCACQCACRPIDRPILSNPLSRHARTEDGDLLLTCHLSCRRTEPKRASASLSSRLARSSTCSSTCSSTRSSEEGRLPCARR